MLILGAFLLLGAVLAFAVALGLFVPEVSIANVARRVRAGAGGQAGLVVDQGKSLGVMRLFTMPFLIERAERNFVLLGHQAGWTMRRLMLMKTVAAAVLGLVGFAYFSSEPSGRRLAMLLVMTGLAFFYPDMWLSARAKERQVRIERELPDVLDQVVIAIEAGMSFEGALDRVARNGRGELADELTRTLQDMRLGMSRREAYYGLASRTSIEDLRRFCKQVVQAEEFGVSIATVVRNLAHEMRIKRKYRAEEIAQKIPVKIIFPLAFCFMPVLFVVVLYPSVASLLESLSK